MKGTFAEPHDVPGILLGGGNPKMKRHRHCPRDVMVWGNAAYSCLKLDKSDNKEMHKECEGPEAGTDL